MYRGVIIAVLLLLFTPAFALADSCPALSLGSTGSSVRAVQNILHAAYTNFPTPTGYFGPITETAVKQWQSEHGITSIGIVGPLTGKAMGLCTATSVIPPTSPSPALSAAPSTSIAAISRTLYRGIAGSDVVALQQFLISQNLLAAGNATGYFGPLTEAAVKSFQRSKGIVSSGTSATTGYGVVGPRTRAVIVARTGTRGEAMNTNQTTNTGTSGIAISGSSGGGSGGSAGGSGTDGGTTVATPPVIVTPVAPSVKTDQTSYRCTGQNDGPTIQALIDKGGIVSLEGSCVHTAPLILRESGRMGNDRGYTIIEGGVLVGPGIIVDGARFVTMRNIEIRSSGTGIMMRNALGLSLHNVLVNSRGDGLVLEHVADVRVTGTSRFVGVSGVGSVGVRVGEMRVGWEALQMLGTRVQNYDTGIKIAGAGSGNNLNMILNGITIDNARDTAISVIPGGDASVRNVHISDCTITDSNHSMVFDQARTSGKIQRVMVNRCSIIAQHQIEMNGSPNVVVSNVVYSAGLPQRSSISVVPMLPDPAPLSDIKMPAEKISCSASSNERLRIQTALDRGGRVVVEGRCDVRGAPLYIRKSDTVLEGGFYYGDGINAENVQNVTLRSLEISSFGVGISVRNVNDISIQNVYAHTDGDGLVLDAVRNVFVTGVTTFDGVLGRGTYAVRVNSLSGPSNAIVFDGLNTETHDNGIRLGGSSSVSSVLIHNSFFSASTYGVLVNPSGTASVSNVELDTVWFWFYPDPAVHGGIPLAVNAVETSGSISGIGINGAIILGSEREPTANGSARITSSHLIHGPLDTTYVVLPSNVSEPPTRLFAGLTFAPPQEVPGAPLDAFDVYVNNIHVNNSVTVSEVYALASCKNAYAIAYVGKQFKCTWGSKTIFDGIAGVVPLDTAAPRISVGAVDSVARMVRISYSAMPVFELLFVNNSTGERYPVTGSFSAGSNSGNPLTLPSSMPNGTYLLRAMSLGGGMLLAESAVFIVGTVTSQSVTANANLASALTALESALQAMLTRFGK